MKGLININKLYMQVNACMCVFYYISIVNITHTHEYILSLSASNFFVFTPTDMSNKTMTHYVQCMNCYKQMLRIFLFSRRVIDKSSGIN